MKLSDLERALDCLYIFRLGGSAMLADPAMRKKIYGYC